MQRSRIVLGSADGRSGRALSREVGVSLPTVQRWLDRYEADGLEGLEDRPRPGRPHRLNPHRVRYFKVSTDPRLVEKLRDVVGPYVAPPERAIVFCFDEKSQIQALVPTHPGLPLKRGRAGTMTHNYKRHGTTTPFAALNVATGEVIHQCLPRHRHQEFLRFLRAVEKPADPEIVLHFILDNYATHAPESEGLAGEAPAGPLPLPAHLGLVAQPGRALFSELTQRQLKRLAVHSVDQLVDAMTTYIEQRNQDSKPFVWTATVKDILTKVRQANNAFATLH